jgi:hypothetical protein
MNERPLARRAVNLSISESDDSISRGFPVWQVNRVTLQVTTSLLGQGASVVFGHDWREDGVMQAIHGFAQQIQPPVPLSAAEARASNQPLLINVLPWPDTPRLSSQDLERLASTLRVELAGLPDELRLFEDKARKQRPSDPLYRYVRARALTHLRHRLNDESDARFCIGGRTQGSAGRYPGVIEEALLAIQEAKPLFLVGFLGGAARQVIDAIQGHEMPDNFCPTGIVDQLYKTPPIPETDRRTQGDRLQHDRKVLWEEFRRTGVGGLAERNRLGLNENEELFHTPVLDRVIELVLTGLSRL